MPLDDRQLSPHFWLSEFTTSQAAARLVLDNTPPPQALANLARLAGLLEVVRQLLGDRPLVISSGYRSEAVNRAVKGAVGSAHLFGCAADFHVPGLSPLEVCRLLVSAPGLGFEQLIDEGDWVHLAVPQYVTADNARTGGQHQVLTAQFNPGGKKTTYLPGLVNAPQSASAQGAEA
jgi:hypothetical protein